MLALRSNITVGFLLFLTCHVLHIVAITNINNLFDFIHSIHPFKFISDKIRGIVLTNCINRE